jgi:hypothetical protein
LSAFFKNGGRELRPKGQPEPVRVHDFVIAGDDMDQANRTSPRRGNLKIAATPGLCPDYIGAGVPSACRTTPGSGRGGSCYMMLDQSPPCEPPCQ